jgi:hypothetical protein
MSKPRTVCLPEEGGCGKIVAGVYGHGPGCSMPTADDEPSQLPRQVPADNPWGSVPNPVDKGAGV